MKHFEVSCWDYSFRIISAPSGNTEDLIQLLSLTVYNHLLLLSLLMYPFLPSYTNVLMFKHRSKPDFTANNQSSRTNRLPSGQRWGLEPLTICWPSPATRAALQSTSHVSLFLSPPQVVTCATHNQVSVSDSVCASTHIKNNVMAQAVTSQAGDRKRVTQPSTFPIRRQRISAWEIFNHETKLLLRSIFSD